VAGVEKERFWVVYQGGECPARVSGRLWHRTAEADAFPTAGDWVVLEVEYGEGLGIIHAILPRMTRLMRKAAGRSPCGQVLAANMDTIFLVCGLDGDFNVRRIERYLAPIRESGTGAVVVLNKADLCAEVDGRVREARMALPDLPLAVVSAKTGEGLETLASFLGPAQTAVLVGSSGTGKSTLVNRFLGVETQATASVRENDIRGRHTTTSRHLFFTPGGAILMDTPGMREFQLWCGEGAVEGEFEDIESLAGGCRFRDCQHASEPDCAVRVAIEEGRMDPKRLEHWRKLRREARFWERMAKAQKPRHGKRT
jgi:ribosome biogenesis GTPase